MAHIHKVYDTDNHFIIDGATRVVKNVSQTKTMLVQHDHNSERFTFELPRYVDGHDLSLCNVVQVHYINTDAKDKESYVPGLYHVDDLQVFPGDDSIVVCSWLISGNATKFVGPLAFCLRFVCNQNVNEVDYSWSTAVHSNVYVTDGINNTDEIYNEQFDAFVYLEHRITVLEKYGTGGTAGLSWEAITDKPFGEVYGDTVYWDGDIKGLDQLRSGTTAYPLYHVTAENQAAPSAEEMRKATFVVRDLVDGTTDVYTSLTVETRSNGNIYCSTSTGFVLAVVNPDTGLYLHCSESGLLWVASVTIPGYTGFISRKKMDAKYLPEPSHIDEKWVEDLKTEMGGVVSTVNGVKPDANGNVQIAVSGGSGGNAGQSGNKWNGKTFNFMGDSITEGYASTVKYTDVIASALSARCNNYGIGGSTVANGQNPMYSRVLQMDEDADLCVVFGGTNDFANYDRVLGEQFIVSEGKRTLNLDTNTFYGGLNQLCTNLYSRFPYSTLVICTPINRQSFAGQETDMQANGIGLYLDEYVEAIKKVAAYFSIPCLDLYATANLHPYDSANIAKYYSASDQLHPNAEGHKHIANVMLAFFDTLADKRGRTIEDDSGNTGGDSDHTHSYTSTVTAAATCTTAGVKTYTCSCGDSYTESIPATGHNYVDGVCTVCGLGIEYSVADMSGVLEVKEGSYYNLSGGLISQAWYASWKIPCKAGDEFKQYSTTGFGMYKTYWDSDGNFISSDTPPNGSPTTFTVPDNANIAYMWTAIEKKDIDDGSFKLIRYLAETVH